MFSLCGVEWSLSRNSFHQGQHDTDRGGTGGGGWKIEPSIKLLHLLVNARTTPPFALDVKQHWVKETHWTRQTKSITFEIKPLWDCYLHQVVTTKTPAFTLCKVYIINKVINVRGIWLPQQDVLVNAHCSDSQPKSRGVNTVWNIVLSTGHQNKEMLLGGALWPEGTIYL